MGKGLFFSTSECFLFFGIWVEVDLLFIWVFEVDLWGFEVLASLVVFCFALCLAAEKN